MTLFLGITTYAHTTVIAAYVMGLAAKTDRPVDADAWQTAWLVERQVEPGEEGKYRAFAGSNALLVWEAGEQRGPLESRLAGRLTQGGEVDLPGGQRGAWVLGLGDQVGEVVIGIAWTCPAQPEGPTQYVALRFQDDPGPEGWGPALLDLAGRLRCVP